jgi:hypothetical protein
MARVNESKGGNRPVEHDKNEHAGSAGADPVAAAVATTEEGEEEVVEAPESVGDDRTGAPPAQPNDEWKNVSGRDIFLNLPDRQKVAKGKKVKIIRGYRKAVIGQCGTYRDLDNREAPTLQLLTKD